VHWADTLDALKVLGGITALLTFLWTALRNYLVLGMEIRKPEPGDVVDPVIKVSLTNSGPKSKFISYAVLLISPDDVPLQEAITRITGKETAPGDTRSVRSLYLKDRHSRVEKGGCVLIPLKELYANQHMVGPGEAVSHALSVNSKQWQCQRGVTYLVRFFVFVSYGRDLYVRWRFTADAFRVALPANSSGLTESAPTPSHAQLSPERSR
jgi:hypothetical protein